MKVKVKYLMWFRDLAGIDFEEVQINGELTLAELIELIKERRRELRKFLDSAFSEENPTIILINGTKKNSNYVVKDGDEVVLLPSVSGG